MDTDVNNYSYNEILNLLKLSDDTNVDVIIRNTLKTINKIENSTIENKQQLTEFFKKCFTKVMFINNYTIPKDIVDILNLQLPDTTNNRTSTLPTPITRETAINTIQSEYALGTVNPIKRDTIKHVLVLNTKYEKLEKINVCNKISGCESKVKIADFTTNLIEPYKNVISIKLDSIQFNNAYYPFSYYLDTVSFTIKTFNYKPSLHEPTKKNLTSYEIVISEGTYTVNTLLKSINNAIQDLSSSDIILNSIKLLYNSTLGKYLFFLDTTSLSPPPGFAYGFDLDFTTTLNPDRPSYLNMGWLIGFQKEYYDYFEDYKITPDITGFIAECPAKLIGSSFFLIEVEDYNKNNPVLINYNITSPYSFNVKNILAIIPNNLNTNYSFEINMNQEQKQENTDVSQNQFQTQSNVSDFNDLSKQQYISSQRDIFKTRRYFGPVRIKKLRIRLLDENGRVLYLNNCNFTLTLEIETLFSSI
jgi:hypothetical protein